MSDRGNQSCHPVLLNWIDSDLQGPMVPAGTMRLTRSLTSGLTRRASDEPGVFWGVGDRGPNIKPGDAVKRFGLVALQQLIGLDGARVMPLPQTGPALARFRLSGHEIVLDTVVPLHAGDGTMLTGIPPAPLPGMETEPAFTIDGVALPPSSFGADTEGIAALPDGRFWIADEYGPSLLLVSANGVVERRLVPIGGAAMFTGSPVPVEEVFPAIALTRKLNRGFEGLALSTNENVLFVAFQSPLAHPDRGAHDGGDLVRIWALDPQTGGFICEYAYPLDPPSSFIRDCAAGPVAPSDVKVSELTVLPDGSLLVLERVTQSTHIYRIRPMAAYALQRHWCDPSHRPTLEQVGQAGCGEAGIVPLAKELVFSTDAHSKISGDLEGMVAIEADTLLLASDNDYGIDGASTHFWRISLPAFPIRL